MAKDLNGKSRERRPPPPPWVAPAPDPTPPPEEVKVISTGGTAEPAFGLAPEAQAILPGPPSSYLVTSRRNSTEFVRGTFAITPDDSNALPKIAMGLWVGGAGNLTLKMQDGSTAVFTAVAAGTMLPVVATQIMATGTTATLLVGLR